MANNAQILLKRVYQQNNEKVARIGLTQPAKFKNSRYYLNTPRRSHQEFETISKAFD
jgi:hypothetical protein